MRTLGVIVLAVMMLALSPTNVLADPVQVRASRGDGYGRLTFRWPRWAIKRAVKAIAW